MEGLIAQLRHDVSKVLTIIPASVLTSEGSRVYLEARDACSHDSGERLALPQSSNGSFLGTQQSLILLFLRLIRVHQVCPCNICTVHGIPATPRTITAQLNVVGAKLHRDLTRMRNKRWPERR